MGNTASSSSSATHLGFGKLIIFGEHFVVHNQRPSLVGALEAYTTCQVELYKQDAEGVQWSCGLTVIDNRVAVPGYKDDKQDEMLESCRLVLQCFAIDTKKQAVKIVFGGELCCVSGVGASAASCVALARALNAQLDRHMTEHEINACAFEGEKGYHGTPSGIDNTCSTFGGLLKFQRSSVQGGAPKFETLSLDKPVLLVYASTGLTSSTTEVVGDVRRKKEADEDWYAQLQQKYDDVYERGLQAVLQGDAKAIGKCCTENQALLKELSVSCPELERLIDVAMSTGRATGAKLAGTGRGGLMFAICETEEDRDAVYDALNQVAPQCWKTKFQ